MVDIPYAAVMLDHGFYLERKGAGSVNGRRAPENRTTVTAIPRYCTYVLSDMPAYLWYNCSAGSTIHCDRLLRGENVVALFFYVGMLRCLTTYKAGDSLDFCLALLFSGITWLSYTFITCHLLFLLCSAVLYVFLRCGMRLE